VTEPTSAPADASPREVVERAHRLVPDGDVQQATRTKTALKSVAKDSTSTPPSPPSNPSRRSPDEEAVSAAHIDSHASTRSRRPNIACR
jgi:hypothetical protein